MTARSEPTAPSSSSRKVIRLLTQPSGWRRIKVFGASASAPKRRRRADGITLVWLVMALLVVASTTRTVSGVEAAIADAVAALPSLVAPIAAVPYDLLAVWAVLVLVLALVRGHWRLALGLAIAVPLGIVATVLLNRGLDLAGTGDDLALGASLTGVPVQLVVSLSMVTVASRELSRPFRSFGRRLAWAAAIGALFVPVTSPYRVICAALAAGAVTALVRLALGSPRTTVSAADVRHGLRDLGVDAEPLPGGSGRDHPVVRPDGTRLTVRVVGRDEWDTQLLTTLWKFAWYRNSGAVLHLSSRQQIEHEAFLVLLAQSRQASVTPVVAAGVSRTGDALLATETDGTELGQMRPTDVDDALLQRLWVALARLHESGIAHGALHPAAIFVDDRGGVRFASFSLAQPITRLHQPDADRAQLLATTAIAVGPDRAITAALDALEPGDAAPLVAHLQSAAMDARLRRALEAASISLADLRSATAEAAGIDVPELQKIWRVSWGAILRLALLGLVAYLLISQLADIGLDTIIEAVQEASLPILLFALLLGQVPRVASAGSLQAAAPVPVPLGRVTKLVFATTFVNLAMPSTAARAAMSIRFFQRSGTTSAGAVSAGALDSVSGFIAQITLLGGLLLFGFGTLGFGGLPSGTEDRSDLWTAVAVVVGLIAAAVIVVALVPHLRRRALDFLGQLREALTVLRSPGSVVRLLGFNLLAELLFSLTIWTVLLAFGQDVDFPDVVIINEAVALFAGLIPVPGGVGVTEGALTTGFIAVGVPEDIAFSAALAYRMCTFYLPPIWGYFAFSSLRRDQFL